jgi:hypothetical protein
MTAVTHVPFLPNPLCSSVSGRSVPGVRRIGWALAAVLSVTLLVMTWPGAWIGFAALLLPDVPLLYLNGKDGRLAPRAVPYYNATHLLAGPIVTLGLGAMLGSAAVIGVGAAWLVHVTVDRALGYDLRDRTGNIRS